jgi:hypothetical protein
MRPLRAIAGALIASSTAGRAGTDVLWYAAAARPGRRLGGTGEIEEMGALGLAGSPP